MKKRARACVCQKKVVPLQRFWKDYRVQTVSLTEYRLNLSKKTKNDPKNVEEIKKQQI